MGKRKRLTVDAKKYVDERLQNDRGDKMSQMKVAVTVDEKYLYPLKVMLHSLFTTQEENVVVYLLHTQIKEELLIQMEDFCASYGAKLQVVKMENTMFANAPIRLYFTIEMYYRLLLPWILPREDKILYLDPDLVVINSLKDFWNMNLGDYEIAGIRERLLITKEHRKNLGLASETVYLNSGVLLMDLAKIRKNKTMDDIQKVLTEKEKVFIYPDQDLLNVLWEGQMRQVEDGYNLNPNICYLKEYMQMLTMKGMRKCASILHYMGAEKPWKKGYLRGAYLPWAKAEYAVNPQMRIKILGRMVLEPVRIVYMLMGFAKGIKHLGEKIRTNTKG